MINLKKMTACELIDRLKVLEVGIEYAAVRHIDNPNLEQAWNQTSQELNQRPLDEVLAA